MGMKGIAYFDRSGSANTEGVIQAVQKGVKELGIGHVVIASDTGE